MNCYDKLCILNVFFNEKKGKQINNTKNCLSFRSGLITKGGGGISNGLMLEVQYVCGGGWIDVFGERVCVCVLVCEMNKAR